MGCGRSQRESDGEREPGMDENEVEGTERISRVSEKALELFDGNGRAAGEWMSSPLVALGGVAPRELAKTEHGAREVESLIGRIEHGIFS
jgi:putative toxin-antitoxin system antitoxin component (TIGR02293 family)